ncbi:MAG: BamA/TamA family outer membrane protein [Candidatus Eremiobacteraeota bacterium]|nr:BamA/TamA family outer membrane protein [Candidatus Eremiobacteraeota bacterium]
MIFRARALRVAFLIVTILANLAPASSNAQGAPKVVSVSVSGNVHVPTDRILSVVKTKPGDPFDEKTVQEDLANIFALGFFTDQVPPVIKQRPDGIAITFRVIENPVLTKILFEGNEHVPADTLLALMDTAVGQVFNSNTFHQDVLKINSYYNKIGYGGQLATHVPDLSITQDGVLTLKIQEGLRVRNIIIVPPPNADPLLPPTVILPVLSVKPGQPYSEDLRDKDFESLKKLYEKYDLQIGDLEAGIDPATVDLKNGTADVRYSISVARVGAIEITGNTKTHDDVIRRELRLRVGDVITQAGLRRDYERLNNLGFFEKVDFSAKPGPDPKKPADITVDWNVKEQRTGTATVGAGYSGGLTGTGLTGNVSYSENNINGTGNSATVRLERGARYGNAQVSFTIPYFGKTEKSQRWSVGATIFLNGQTNYYPVYGLPGGGSGSNIIGTNVGSNIIGGGGAVIGAIPVSLVPLDPTNPTTIAGVVSTYKASSSGITLNGGRRLTDIWRASLGVNIQQVASSVAVPSPYFFNTAVSPLVSTGNISGISQVLGGGSVSGSQALGVTAPSIANINSTAPFNLRSLVLGLNGDTRDDVFSPRRGGTISFSEELSGKPIGSDFTYTLSTLDITKFFPVLKASTFGLHGLVGTSTGAIPPNRLYTFSDQYLRGYSTVFYGTNEALFQAELRVPVTQDRKFTVAAFFDDGGVRIRGALPVYDPFGNIILNPNRWTFYPDAGVGLRFDVPQLGLRTLRLDFARGNQGAHTAFGIGQSF